MQTNEVSMQDGSSGFGGGGFGASITSNSGFGGGQSFAPSSSSSLNPSAPSFAPQAFAPAPSFGPSPFGKQTTQDDDMGDARPGQSPVPEASMISPTPDNPFDATATNGRSGIKKEDELARLKAKLAAKKKLLEEAKLRKNATDNSPPPSPKQRASSPKPGQPGTLAERNALRFAPKINATRSQLPSNLKTSTVSTEKEYDAIDLQNAKSLVGTCQYMCPDNELKRRENEGDIQLLETIHPDIHPAGWNFRNTAVKRFRRSAADYKLDIPELIRPPDVLERVCAYLEEWVIERDRQGPDPRFATGAAPAPLEAYQFIWDRTRMVRKDFILQNYVGTGGKCDARAVRCHERIARWHAMCEHQLSHIPDFVRMQSQQNIAEMGQAMKTLNLFYDDSLGRSTVDVPDEGGKETRTNSTTHGCESNVVMGVSPVDYDGKALRNDESTVSHRLIGNSSPARGTAEPEMRAIYILLTLENDGGMEVLKYAAKLSSERPDVFNSKPVQLALEIFKAKHELNYARFFSILRAPTTPYLFACLMFKHVEEMRRVAIRVMYLTYGYKKKDAPAIQDQYPLRSLVRLLCFEDDDEARSACQHYNITAKEVDLASSSSPTGKKRLELIFWKGSRFTIPKDEVKGVVIPLRPLKMLRTIESKLNGITRLAVCRGEASGEGSALLQVPNRAVTATPAAPLSAEQLVSMREKEHAAALRREQEMRKEAERKRKEEDEQRQKMDLKRKLEEKKRLVKLARKEAEEENARVSRQKQLELESAQKKAKEKEQLRKEEEGRIVAVEKARRQAEAELLEQKRVLAETAAKKLAEEQEARRKAEEEERERQRQEKLHKEREEHARQRKLIEEEKAKKRIEKMLTRQRLVEEQLEIERQEKRRRSEEEATKKAEEEEKVNLAKKLLLWRRIRHNLAKAVQKNKTEQSLKRIDPTFSTTAPVLFVHNFNETEQVQETDGEHEDPDELPLADFLETLVEEKTKSFQLSAVLTKACKAFTETSTAPQRYANYLRDLKLAVLVPEFEGVQPETAHELLHKWIGNRFNYNVVETVNSHDSEIRFIAVDGNKDARSASIDIALLVIPPFMNDVNFTKSALVSTLLHIDESVPVFALNLDDGSDPDYMAFIEDALSACCAQRVVDINGDETHDFDEALGVICSEIMGAFLQEEERKRQEEEEQRQQIELKHKLEGQQRLAELTRNNADDEESARVVLQKQLEFEKAQKQVDEKERRWMEESRKAAEEAREDEQGDGRPRTPKLNEEFIPRHKRSYDDADCDQPAKRSREETPQERASKAFTAKLEAMFKGDVVVDMKVGGATLGGLLVNVPSVRVMPEDF